MKAVKDRKEFKTHLQIVRELRAAKIQKYTSQILRTNMLNAETRAFFLLRRI